MVKIPTTLVGRNFESFLLDPLGLFLHHYLPLLPLCHHSTAAKGRHGRPRQRSAAGLTCAQQQKAGHFRLESWQNCPTYRHFQLSTNYLSLISKWALRTFEPIKIKNYYNQSKNHLMGFTPRVESVSRILPSPPIYVRKI